MSLHQVSKSSSASFISLKVKVIYWAVSGKIFLNLVCCVQVYVSDGAPRDTTAGQISSWAKLTYQEHGPKKKKKKKSG